jgi:hypothetical protein
MLARTVQQRPAFHPLGDRESRGRPPEAPAKHCARPTNVLPISPTTRGFGRSDKPGSSDSYTYAAHVEWMRAIARVVIDFMNR